VCLLGSALLALGVGASSARAEELIAAGGATDTDDHTSGSYAWGLDYRQRLLEHFDASLGYLNEGHIPGHHRDGVTLKLWARTDLWQGRVHLGVGAGPYAYFDTQTMDVPGGYRDYHGVGGIATAAAGIDLGPHWFLEAQLSQEYVPGNEATRTAMLAVGYRLDSFLEHLQQSAAQSEARGEPLNEIGMFVGETIVNSLHADASLAYGAEYRRHITSHLELSASILDEGDGTDGRHVGATGSAWVVQEFLDQKLSIGAGIGVWGSFQTFHTIYSETAASFSGLASMTVSWRLSRAFDLRFIWHRAFTNDDQDRDIVTLGVGWRY
jgi:hypothetical protein